MNEVDYSPKSYIGNGITKEFSFDWKVFKNTDLIVKLIDSEDNETLQELAVDYTATIESVGGKIDFTTAPAEGITVVIERKLPLYQSTGYSTSSGFQGSEIEKSFDRVSCNLQDMDYNIETFKTSFSSQTNDKIDANKADTDQQIEKFEDEVNQDITDFKNKVNENVSAMDNRVTTNTNNIQKHVIDVNKALAEFEPLFNEKLDIAQGYAETSETNATIAVNAKNNAEIYMNNAKTYMNNAETYQNNALTYKNSANSSATVTTNKANEALTSANIATQKAKETSDYAQFAADCLASCQSIKGQFSLVSFLSGGSSANILQEDIYDGGSSSVLSENVYSGGNSEYKNVLTYDDIKNVHEITALQALVKTLVNRIEALENIKTISGGVAVA